MKGLDRYLTQTPEEYYGTRDYDGWADAMWNTLMENMENAEAQRYVDYYESNQEEMESFETKLCNKGYEPARGAEVFHRVFRARVLTYYEE